MKGERFILATQNHPFYGRLKGRVVSKVPAGESVVIDLTLTSPKKKEQTLKDLEGHTVISDLTCYRGEEWVNSYPHVVGALAAAFPSSCNSCEIWVKNDVVRSTIKDFLEELEMGMVQVRSPGIGFLYPRILSMVINEAWLALADGLADRDNIDLAMKNGVNYPWGPFEWGKKIGLDKIRTLLDELHHATGDERYRPCHLLKEAL